MRAVILNGYHAGAVAELEGPSPPAKISLNRPASLTPQEFFSDRPLNVLTKEKPSEEEIYQLTFVGLDRKVVLYSTSGRSEDFIDNEFVLENWLSVTEQ